MNGAINANEPLLSPSEASRLLNVSIRTLENWRARHEGPPFVKFSPRVIRYRLPELLIWLRLHTQGAIESGGAVQ